VHGRAGALAALPAAPEGQPVLVSDLTFCGAVQADPARRAATHPGRRLAGHRNADNRDHPRREHPVRGRGGDGGRALGGDPADVAALAAAADLTLDRVVEDAAHAVGSSHRSRRVGDGSAVCFSFYATKNLPIGEGGMITTDDPERASWLRQGAAARHVGRRVASLPARRRLEVRRPRGRHEGQHDRPAGRHRPRPARAAPRWQAMRLTTPRATTAGSPTFQGWRSRTGRKRAGHPRLAPVPGAGRGPERSRDEVMATLDAAGVGTVAALHPDPSTSSTSAAWPTCRRRGCPVRRRSSPADLAAALSALAGRPDPPGGRRSGRCSGRSGRSHPDASVAARAGRSTRGRVPR
jgi:hypothetical protein